MPRNFGEAHSHFKLSTSLTTDPLLSFLPHRNQILNYLSNMRFISVGSLFSKKPAKLKKKRSNESPSFRSTATSSSSDDRTPKSVIPRSESWPMLSQFIPVSDLFTFFDRDGDGKITKQELEIVLRRLSPYPPTDDELTSMVTEIDLDGDGCISLEELGAIGPGALADPAGGSELRDAFSVFDADGDGKISAEELLGVFLAIGDGGCTLIDCRRMIAVVDSDGDGYVCFNDFTRMMYCQR